MTLPKTTIVIYLFRYIIYDLSILPRRTGQRILHEKTTKPMKSDHKQCLADAIKRQVKKKW